MIFYIYFDPAVIKDANEQGNYAIKHLQEILKGISINCSILTFEDYHQITEIGELVNQLPESFDRRELTSLFTYLKKNNRFNAYLIPDYVGGKSDLRCLNEQYIDKELDIILLSQNESESYEWEVETATIDTYNESIFEKERYSYCRSGRTISDDEYDELIYLNKFLRKLLLNANHIEICDYSFGKNVRDDYIYSWKVLIHWFAGLNNPNRNIKITIHSDKGDQGTSNFIMSELSSHLPINISNIEIFMKYYVPLNTNTALPHERFIYTEQFAFNIGRGLDLFKHSNGKTRKTALSYMNVKDVRKDVEACKHLLDSPSEIQIC
ncbi:MAG: hypothetical protein HND39_09410 [Ignavibacteriota bacterium]|nr:MAG: hypothetical protein EDM72_04335 [Chlorobiota bacterium]MBL1123634.1 hypothetical protein [Ignavibacteriota bacterium]MCC7095529.1 hypothetical protein [Ignavibacteriaceae bacterium]MCE7855509.1 hypothetical protein [Ignavibacteria bacterium CHB3]MEB2296347.1 hypothetical protein [Ignavibacteria bacterium]